jgi:peptidoglycan/LPS O-acetylase OafA/YrhL
LPTASSAASARIPELDGLRGLAISSVLLCHYIVLTTVSTPATPLSYILVLGRLAWTGVDLFFVLSGFLIGGILLDARASTNYFKIFYTRRFFRIVPIYAVFLLVFRALEFAAQHSHRVDSSWFTLGALPWYSYWTFTQNFWMAHSAGLASPSLSVTWSLAIEEQFYLTLPLLVRFFPRRRLASAVVTGICLAPLTRIVIRHIWPHNWVACFVLMPCRADALLLGVLAAILLRDEQWKTKIRRNNLFFALTMPVFLLGIAFLGLRSASLDRPLMQTFGYTWLALFYVSLLLYSVTRPHSPLSRALRMKWLGWLGGIAYGAYLFHQTVQGLLFNYFWRSEPRITGGLTLLTTLVSLVLTLVLARLSWRHFEHPLIRFSHRAAYAFVEPRANGQPQPAPEAVYP